MSETNPLESILQEMCKAANAELGLVALATAVAVPAICASLAMANGRSQGPEYKEWCRLNLRPQKGFDNITDEELYLMRCGLLHQGRVEIESHKKGKLTPIPAGLKGTIFMVAPPSWTVSDNKATDRYVYSVHDFCGNMAAAAREWLSREHNNPTVLTNLEKMMRYRPFESPGIRIEPAPMAIF